MGVTYLATSGFDMSHLRMYGHENGKESAETTQAPHK